MTLRTQRAIGLIRASLSVAAFCLVAAVCAPVLRHVSAGDYDQGWFGVFTVLIISATGVLTLFSLFKAGMTWRGATWPTAWTLYTGWDLLFKVGLLLCVAGLIIVGHVVVYWPPSTTESAAETILGPMMVAGGELMLIREARLR